MATKTSAPRQRVYRYIIVGDTEFTERQFRSDSECTLGVEMGSRHVTVNGDDIKLEIWDTAGQESYLAITRSYYRGADGCLLVYDISRKKTFAALSMWLSEARQNSNNPNLVVMMIGNKADLTADRQVSTDEAREFAVANNLIFMELSAKNYAEVEAAFLKTAERIYEISREHGRAVENGIKLGKNDLKSKKSGGGDCCK